MCLPCSLEREESRTTVPSVDSCLQTNQVSTLRQIVLIDLSRGSSQARAWLSSAHPLKDYILGLSCYRVSSSCSGRLVPPQALGILLHILPFISNEAFQRQPGPQLCSWRMAHGWPSHAGSWTCSVLLCMITNCALLTHQCFFKLMVNSPRGNLIRWKFTCCKNQKFISLARWKFGNSLKRFYFEIIKDSWEVCKNSTERSHVPITPLSAMIPSYTILYTNTIRKLAMFLQQEKMGI